MKWLLALAAFAGTFLLEFNLAQAAAPVCAPEIVVTCDQLAKGPQNLAGNKSAGFASDMTKSGTILNSLPLLDSIGKQKTNMELSAEFLKIGEPTPAQISKAPEIGRTLRDRAIALILDVAPGSAEIKKLTASANMRTMAPEKRIAIERLLALNFKVAERKHPACDIMFAEGIPNATFLPDQNTVLICGSMASQNEAVIALSLSHEIGHAISPNSTSLWQYKIKGRNADETWDLARNCDPNFIYSETAPYNEDEAVLLNSSLELGARSLLAPTNSRVLDSLERCGVLEFVENSKTDKAEAFLSTRSCIENKTRAIFDQELNGAVAAKELQDHTSVELARKALESPTARMTFSLAAEEFGDSFGSKLFDGALLEMKWSAADIRAALVAYRIGDCQQARPGDSTRDRAQYPAASERIKQLLAQPNTSKTLGCTAPTVQCDFSIDATKAVAPIKPASSVVPNVPQKKNSKSGSNR